MTQVLSHRLAAPQVMVLGVALVIASLLVASARGAYEIELSGILRALWAGITGSQDRTPEQLIFLNIRLPRLLLGLAAGAALGMSGALMQGMFRNPLADPGLIGISSGAALAAGIPSCWARYGFQSFRGRWAVGRWW